MRITILHDAKDIGKHVGDVFEETLHSNPKAVLGLATGSSPLPIYADLIARYQKGAISFREATTFNLDEYLDCPLKDQTYRFFMNHNLFGSIDLRKGQTHFPDPHHPENYDDEIAKAGGVDLQLLGIGRDGHIGFNEPGTPFVSLTHIVTLAESTLEANARFFGGDPHRVPKRAVTMGLGTILKAKRIILVADDSSKRAAIEKLMSHQKDVEWPATVLNDHPNVDVFITEDVLH
jgi:glucosamine-6-phosphate deaminase